MIDDLTFLDALLQEYEQTGSGVRTLSQRLKQAATCSDFIYIAAEAQRRISMYQVPPNIETADQVFAALARLRLQGWEGIHHG